MTRLLIFTLLNFMGAMSPGPDFAIVTRFGLTGSRKAALYATLGITLALFFHVAYCILGVSVVLQQTPALFSGVQLVGACYLLYIAIPMLFAKESSLGQEGGIVARKALSVGFWGNLLNPKATVLILSLFVQFLEPGDTLMMKIMFGLAVPLSVMTWFCLYSYFLTHKAVVPFVQKGQKVINCFMGILLIALSLFIIWNTF